MEFFLSKHFYMTAAHATHILSTSVWLGVMLFNLFVGFPMYWARSASYKEYMRSLAEQATRAVYWLYPLVALTAVSGWMIAAESTAPGGLLAYSGTKTGLLLAMLACHLYATLRVWPRIFFAFDNEFPILARQYVFTILGSALLGIMTVFITAYRLSQ
jgi:uncharacterized membrane protein